MKKSKKSTKKEWILNKIYSYKQNYPLAFYVEVVVIIFLMCMIPVNINYVAVFIIYLLIGGYMVYYVLYLLTWTPFFKERFIVYVSTVAAFVLAFFLGGTWVEENFYNWEYTQGGIKEINLYLDDGSKYWIGNCVFKDVVTDENGEFVSVYAIKNPYSIDRPTYEYVVTKSGDHYDITTTRNGFPYTQKVATHIEVEYKPKRISGRVKEKYKNHILLWMYRLEPVIIEQ